MIQRVKVKTLRITAIFVVLIILAVLSYVTYKLNNRISDDYLRDSLSKANNGGLAERSEYYKIPAEYTLDAGYAETYVEGLDQLVKIYGKDAIKSEIKNGNHKAAQWYIDKYVQ